MAIRHETCSRQGQYREEARSDEDEVTYQDLVMFCEEIGVNVEVASLAWNKLFGKSGGLAKSIVNKLRSTPLSIGRIREYAGEMSGSSSLVLRRDEELIVAWEKTL